MSNTPQETADLIADFLKNIEDAKKMKVEVGIHEAEGLTVYVNEDGEQESTVVEVGAKHEYGSENTPLRSFLRMPFFVKSKELEKTLETQFRLVAEEGKPASDALGIVGLKAQQISQDAFTNGGYGNWTPLSPTTIEEKGSSQILIDTGALGQSITWKVS